ncbi:MAG: hypothetical protein HEQ34_13965 [Sphingorhabdus sp.]|jgi:hypothetical protein|uniref:hypothetical protein n=1 Tax=Sphingorhabdus sp. TaxID=1902408 RepID=UPI0025CDDEEA|nr:hypothetical protein [Sphingorhabdus sp.]MCO4093035.1 hypothetical protein [Sphingorhabdus sp.]
MMHGPSRTSQRAVRLARIAQFICLAGVASRLMFVISIGSDRIMMGHYIRGLVPSLPASISNETWAAFGVVLAMDLSMSIWVFLTMFGLFGALGRGEMTSAGFERRLLRLCLAAFLGTLLSIVARALYVFAAFLTDVAPPYRWGIDLSQDVLYKVVGTIFLCLFVLIVRELRRVDTENKSFV